MKIGTLIKLRSIPELEQSFVTLKDFGLDHCQLSSWDPAKWTNENAVAIKELTVLFHPHTHSGHMKYT